MNLIRTYLLLSCILLASITYAKEDEPHLNGPVKRYSYKYSSVRNFPFMYACHYDREGRKMIDSSYQRNTVKDISYYLFINEYTYSGRFTFVKGYQLRVTSKDTMCTISEIHEYNDKQQLLTKNIQKTWLRDTSYYMTSNTYQQLQRLNNTVHGTVEYTYYPDGLLKEMKELGRIGLFHNSYPDTAKTLYSYEPKKEFTAMFVLKNGEWQQKNSIINYLDDSGRVEMIRNQNYLSMNGYRDIRYSDAAELPVVSKKERRKADKDLSIYYNKDRYGNYLNIYSIDLYTHQTERSIEYY